MTAQQTAPASASGPGPTAGDGPAWAALFDRDGTLVRDVPYNGDPGLVEPMPSAREAVELVRRHGARTAVVTNQSAVGHGLITCAQMQAVNMQVDRLLGPFGTFQACLHTPDDACGCRKPRPALLLRAAAELGVPIHRCVMFGDTEADLHAAAAAGAQAVLVPNERTRTEETAAARRTAPDLLSAVRDALPLRRPR